MALTIDEIRDAQESDPFCQKIRKRLEKGERYSFLEDDSGLVIHVVPLDGRSQMVVPPPFRQRTLHLAHCTPVSGHPGISRHFYTMRKDMTGPRWLLTLRECPRNAMPAPTSE